MYSICLLFKGPSCWSIKLCTICATCSQLSASHSFFHQRQQSNQHLQLGAAPDAHLGSVSISVGGSKDLSVWALAVCTDTPTPFTNLSATSVSMRHLPWAFELFFFYLGLFMLMHCDDKKHKHMSRECVKNCLFVLCGMLNWKWMNILQLKLKPLCVVCKCVCVCVGPGDGTMMPLGSSVSDGIGH